jgi:hypothetical protein
LMVFRTMFFFLKKKVYSILQLFALKAPKNVLVKSFLLNGCLPEDAIFFSLLLCS